MLDTAIKYVTIISLFIFTQALPTLPPTTGKFFYGDISSGGNENFNSPNFHQSVWLVSDKKWNFTFSLNTDEYFTNLIGNQCTITCEVSKKYNPKDSNTGEVDVNAPDETWSVNYQYQKQFQSTSVLRSAPFLETIRLQVNQYKRETIIRQTIQVVEEASSQFISETDGVIGLAPYSQDVAVNKNYNFMYQIKEGGFIDHNVVSFYQNNQYGNSSYVKFGSYDTKAIAKDQTMKMIQTNSLNSWSVASNYVQYNGVPYKNGDNLVININPSLPYIYLSDNGWNTTTDKIKILNPTLDCDYAFNSCKFAKKCSNILIPNNVWSIKIIDTTHANDFDMNFNIQDLLIPGSEIVGKSGENECYLTIFRSGSNKGSNEWIFGAQVLQQYYMVYDMTPHDERGANYAYVGFAPKNPDNIVLASHYDTSFPGYHNYTDDQSKEIKNVVPGPPKPDDKGSSTILITCICIFLIIILVYVLITQLCCKKTDQDKTFSTAADYENLGDLQRQVKADRQLPTKRASLSKEDGIDYKEPKRLMSVNV